MPSSTGRERQARAGMAEPAALKTRVTGVEPSSTLLTDLVDRGSEVARARELSGLVLVLRDAG